MDDHEPVILQEWVRSRAIRRHAAGRGAECPVEAGEHVGFGGREGVGDPGDEEREHHADAEKYPEHPGLIDTMPVPQSKDDADDINSEHPAPEQDRTG